jgi:phosphogluconate dehydratase
MTQLNDQVKRVTDRIRERSQDSRAKYLGVVDGARLASPQRGELGCTNLAHAFAANSDTEKNILINESRSPNIAIVSAYNDMLSAHQPFEAFPALIKSTVAKKGCVAQFAGGVPAMCDGVTQGYEGMELSLFSRDVIAMSTAIAMSHNMFDGALYLGVCDKIVPGLLIGALKFGHVPAIFVPAGPMTSGISNSDKAKTRQLFAEGKVGREALLESESKSYHSAGTCTFYGTANSNQMLMEMMGLHLPSAAFFNPGTEIRDALTVAAAERITDITALGNEYIPVGRMIDERSIVNAVVGLLATGGSTNHTMHLVAMAAAAGIIINWDDFNDLSSVVPLLARVYPNGQADVNHFHAAGGMAYLVSQLLKGGLVHNDVHTVVGQGLEQYTQEPFLDNGKAIWKAGAETSQDDKVLAPIEQPFSQDGGLKVLDGNLGRAVIKTSAVPEQHRVVEAPAKVFHSQKALQDAFKAGELEQDFIAVVKFQGPRANGMPELHKLTPPLGILQDRGFKVALVTDGRMSGASGKVPAAIHITPECLSGGPLAKVKDGDIIRLDATKGELYVKVDAEEFDARAADVADLSGNSVGCGRELFGSMRTVATGAEQGASTFFAQEF